MSSMPFLHFEPPRYFPAYENKTSAQRSNQWLFNITALLQSDHFSDLFPTPQCLTTREGVNPPPPVQTHLFNSSTLNAILPWKNNASRLNLFSFKKAHKLHRPKTLTLQNHEPHPYENHTSLRASPFSFLSLENEGHFIHSPLQAFTQDAHRAYGALGMCALRLGEQPFIFINAKSSLLHTTLEQFSFSEYNPSGMSIAFLHECAHIYQEQLALHGYFFELGELLFSDPFTQDLINYVLYGFSDIQHHLVYSSFSFFQWIREMHADILSLLWFSYLHQLEAARCTQLLNHVGATRKNLSSFSFEPTLNPHDTSRALSCASRSVAQAKEAAYENPTVILKTANNILKKTLQELPKTVPLSSVAQEHQHLHHILRSLTQDEHSLSCNIHDFIAHIQQNLLQENLPTLGWISGASLKHNKHNKHYFLQN